MWDIKYNKKLMSLKANKSLPFDIFKSCKQWKISNISCLFTLNKKHLGLSEKEGKTLPNFLNISGIKFCIAN